MVILAVAIRTGFYLSYKDIALISNTASRSELDNKRVYGTVIRYGFAFKQIGDAMVAVSLFAIANNVVCIMRKRLKVSLLCERYFEIKIIIYSENKTCLKTTRTEHTVICSNVYM